VRSYALRKLDNEGRKEPICVNDYMIEHILPQNDNLSVEWKEAFGLDWSKIQQRWVRHRQLDTDRLQRRVSDVIPAF
jgi:hypothetical protein